jgi:cytoskeletal protein RodZ
MSEAQNFGQYFRQQREERGLSLKEVENATSIRTVYLEAIEQGRFHQVISPVYAKGFVRQYANFIGLDGDRFIQENNHLFGKNMDKVDEVLGLGTLEPRNSHQQNAWLPQAVMAGAVFVMLFAAWWLASYLELV